MKVSALMAMLALTAITFFGMNTAKANAATRKCYTIGTTNTRVYSNTALTRGLGWIYPSDQITVNVVTGRYSQVTYPISGGRTKTGYISTGAILTATGGTTYTSRGKFNTYTRVGGGYYGYVATGDRVMVLGTRGAYTQIKYPVSGGYKYAFTPTSNVTTYLKAQNNNGNNVGNGGNVAQGGLAKPVPAAGKFNKKSWDGVWYGYHDINIGVSLGTPVYAIADGTITFKQAYRTYGGVKYLTSYGNFIEFKSSSGGYTAKYCHLNNFAGGRQYISSNRTKRVSGSKGVYNCGSMNVRKGQVIGYIGQTGNASGVHLHFELRKNGTRIDPTSVIGGLR